MSLIHLTVKHNRTLEEARAQLEMAVNEVQTRFGSMVQRVEWSGDRDQVKLFGTGFEVEMRVDPQELHVSADLPFLGGILGGPLVTGLKGIVQQTFHKQLK
jgi:Putative polyhydroxyalkanoic acid system protein (PHA_gran_rgn)